MDWRVSLDGTAGLVLLAVPWLVLAVVVWRSGRKARRGAVTAARPAVSPDRIEALGVMSGPILGTPEALGGAGEGSVEPQLAPREEPAVLSLRQQEEALLLAVEEAKAARDDPMLSRQCVELARLLLLRSERAQAARLLQMAVLAARRAKLPVVHAEARIELAEVALIDGDLMLACEHWQMAKQMFHETGRRADQDRMADLMRQKRCPSDWMLTNF